MRYVVRTLRDRPALAPLVSAIWYFEGADLTHARESVVPTGAMQILVNLDEDELRCWEREREQTSPGAVLAGLRSGPLVIDTRGARRVTGVSFRPGGAAAFVDERADALADAHVPLDAVWGALGASLRERLLDAGRPEAMLDVWERALVARLTRTRNGPIERALEALEQGEQVRGVARELGWSAKLLYRRFSEAVGLPPKRYARIRRMQRVLRDIARGGERARWAQLAASHGYYDQAHLIRDFRALTGTTPSMYAPRSPHDPNHVRIE